LLFLFVSPSPLHLWILKADAKVIVMTAKIAKATKAANTAKIAKNEKQAKTMKAGKAGPFHIRKDKSIHRLTANAKLCKGDRDDDILGSCGTSWR
jgi:hypothetical protein